MVRGETIFILGGEGDEHALAVRDFLAARGRDAELLDSRWFPGSLHIQFDPPAGTGAIRLPTGRLIELSAIRSVYWRGYAGVGQPDLPDAGQAWIAHNDSRSSLESLLILLPVRWVNGWDAFQLHQTKPVQLARVARLGAAVPRTLLGNDPAAIRQFVKQVGRAIVKPVQGGDHTAPITLGELTPDKLDNLRYAPITVQEEIAGTNIRLFVAGERVMACEIRTAELDYRADERPELLVHSLPPEIAALSRRIARELHLLWTGIDFRLTPEGRYVFLEANPSPMFLGFEAQTGLPLMESLVELLVTE
jgi:glutathione synthase/RimK-type ligase-like ATP-grasp enzyme